MMKRKTMMAIIVAIIVSILVCACGTQDNDTAGASGKLGTDEGKTAWVESFFDNRETCTLNHVVIQKDTEDGDTYLLQVYCTYDKKSKAGTAKKIIRKVSEDMAAGIGPEMPDVNKLSLFWELPQMKGKAKVQFTRNGDSMIAGEQEYDF